MSFIDTKGEFGTKRVFDDSAIVRFSAHYPLHGHTLSHGLHEHPLLERSALAILGETLPDASVEYNRGALPIDVAGRDVPTNGLSIGDTIRQIDSADSWAVLKNIEQNADYEALLMQLLAELQPAIEAATGPMITPEGFVFISSPNAVTPYHFDPEYNILMQIAGSKTMTQFPPDDYRFASQKEFERFLAGSSRNLPWDDSFAEHGRDMALSPGDALYVPLMAPHYVRNGPEPSISLSITWRSEACYEESYAHRFNGLARRFGVPLPPPRPYPGRNVVRSTLWRGLRRLKLVE